METGWSWDQKSLIGELIQGMELTKQLKAASTAESRGSLVQGILSSYEKALWILNWNGGMKQSQMEEANPGLPESPTSVNGSHSSEDSGRGHKDNQDPKEGSKKRKAQPRWTEQVRVNSETGFEGPHEDGYSWRKYGQKDILAAKYPRSYYRCTFRSTQNCWAVKQVQRSDEDPSVFEITYRGKHNCSQGNYLVQSLLSPEKQEKKRKIHDDDHHQNQPLQENKLTFQAMEGIENQENKKASSSTFCFASTSHDIENAAFSPLALDIDTTSLGSFSQSFISPTTPESNYFVPSPFQRSNTGGAPNVPPHSETEVNDIFSANTSSTHSQILDWDFPLEHINSNFSFDSPGFLF